MTAPRPEVAAIVRPLLAYLGAELRARSSSVEELGLVVVAEGRDPAPVRELLGAEVTLRNVRGHQIAAVPLARLRELAQAVTFDVAAEFDVAIAPGQTWCLVLGLEGRAAVLVLHWPSSSALATTLARGQLIGDSDAWVRRAGGGSRPSLYASVGAVGAGRPEAARTSRYARPSQLGAERAARVFDESSQVSPAALRLGAPRGAPLEPSPARSTDRRAQRSATEAEHRAQPRAAEGEHGEHGATADVVRSEHDGRLDRVMGGALKSVRTSSVRALCVTLNPV